MMGTCTPGVNSVSHGRGYFPVHVVWLWVTSASRDAMSLLTQAEHHQMSISAAACEAITCYAMLATGLACYLLHGQA